MMVATGADTHWGNLFDDLEGSIAFRIEFGGLMGKFQVLSLEPDLVSDMVLAWDCSVSFCGFINGFGGLISVLHQLFDLFFRQIII